MILPASRPSEKTPIEFRRPKYGPPAEAISLNSATHIVMRPDEILSDAPLCQPALPDPAVIEGAQHVVP